MPTVSAPTLTLLVQLDQFAVPSLQKVCVHVISGKYLFQTILIQKTFQIKSVYKFAAPSAVMVLSVRTIWQMLEFDWRTLENAAAV